MKNNTVSRDRRLWIGVSLLFVMGFLHRALQLWLLWPELAIAIRGAPFIQVMQLLPKEIMSQHPWWGLWFLQQSPPLPNFIWAGALAITQSPFRLAIIFVLFQGLLSSVTTAAMAILFVRVGGQWWLGLLLASIFFLGSDLLFLEYNPMGYLYYEMMTMLFVVLACHAALSLLRNESDKAAIGLGLCVAGLALTRATFSYFWPVALLWLLCVGFWRKRRIIAIFLLPVFLLHGGWALKNYYAHGYWNWSTSDWGGANMRQGERLRNGSKFNQWLAQQPAICVSPWYELTVVEPDYFSLMPGSWNAVLPPDVVLKDQYIAGKREAAALLDSVAARMWSQCLFKEFFYYWRANPETLIRGAWRSYMVFWQPIRQFQVIRPFPLQIEMGFYAEGPHWFRALRDSFKEWGAGYKMRQTPLQLAEPKPSDFAPAKIIALPFFASFISTFNGVLLHSIPVLLLFAWCLRRRLDWPKGFGFLVLTYAYLAGLSSVVEFPENMRFRIEVEPIIWVICFVVAGRWVRFFRARSMAHRVLL